MKIAQAVGMALFLVMALIAFGLFGVGEIRDNTLTETPHFNESINTTPQIYVSHHATVEEQAAVYSGCIVAIIGLLGIVYIGGIAYDEYKDIVDED